VKEFLDVSLNLLTLLGTVAGLGALVPHPRGRISASTEQTMIMIAVWMILLHDLVLWSSPSSVILLVSALTITLLWWRVRSPRSHVPETADRR
jgi:hypothetical protein